MFESLVCRFVVCAAGKVVWEAGHVGELVVEIVGVFVAFAIADVFHESGDGVAKVERNGIGLGFADIVEDLAVGGVDGIRFGREGEIDHGLREGQVAFGSAEKIESIACSEGEGEGAGFGEADIFTGHADDASREIQAIFAAFDHADEPIESGVGIGVAHGFVERGDEVVVLFARFIVAEEFALEDIFEEFARDAADGGRTARGGGIGGLGAAGAEFEGVVGDAGVAIGIGGDAEKDVVGGIEMRVTKAAFGISEGAVEEIDDLRGGEGIENVDLGAGEERGDDLEGRIFGGGADEEDVAGFNVRQEGVLLGFVEAVNFINEDDGALGGAGFALGLGHDLFDFLDAAEDGAEGDEFAARNAGDDARESGFAAARRAPEKHGTEIVGFDLQAERFAGAEKFFLADEFVESAGSHAFGEGLQGCGGVLEGGVVERGEETHGGSVAQSAGGEEREELKVKS